MKKKDKLTTEEEELVAERLKLLWGFIMWFNPYREKFKEIAERAEEKADTAVAAAVFNPLGWEVNEKKNRRVARRAKLLVKMIDCLEETNEEVAKAEEEMEKMIQMMKTFNF